MSLIVIKCQLVLTMTQSPSAIGALHLNNYFALLIGTVKISKSIASLVSSPAPLSISIAIALSPDPLPA